IRAGWRRAITADRDDLVSLYIPGLYRFYLIRGRFLEGEAELAEADRRGKEDRLAALILARRASLAHQTGMLTARDLLRRSIRILRARDADSMEMGIAIRALAFAASEQGRHR